jgi:hypothetical protein
MKINHFMKTNHSGGRVPHQKYIFCQEEDFHEAAEEQFSRPLYNHAEDQGI